MAGFNIDAAELIELAGALAKVPDGTEKLARVAVRKTARDIKSTAQSIAPVDTGNLKSSIRTSAITPLASEITADANYSVYVEMGTSRMAAQPYMRPAADHHEGAFVQAMEEIAGRALGG